MEERTYQIEEAVPPKENLVAVAPATDVSGPRDPQALERIEGKLDQILKALNAEEKGAES